MGAIEVIIFSSGDQTSIVKMKNIPAATATMVVLINAVPKTLLLSRLGKNLTTDLSRPSLEMRMSRPIDEIRAVAMPTSSCVYNFAASIQKIRPKPAAENEVSMMKMEFLYNGSLRYRRRSSKFLGSLTPIMA